jgi:hypothetical protein
MGGSGIGALAAAALLAVLVSTSSVPLAVVHAPKPGPTAVDPPNPNALYLRHRALDYCLETRVGFGGMIGQGGYPPCMLGGDLRYYRENLRNIYRSSDWQDQFHKSPRCSGCSFDPYCLGVRKLYVETYGDAELVPFTASLPPPPDRPAAPGADPQLVTIRRKGEASVRS